MKTEAMQTLYQYIAVGKDEEVIKGRLMATSEEAAVELLGFDGFKVINVKEITPTFSFGSLESRFSQVKPGDVVLLYRQLALLLESGINIITALDMLREQLSSKILKNVLFQVIADLRSGNQLSNALAKHPKIFSPIYCRSLSVGEQAGGLEQILRQIADYMEKETATAKRTKGALTYPIITLVMTVLVVGLMVTFVLPAFSSLYSSLGAKLPTLTKVMLGASDVMRAYGLYALFVLGAIGAAGYFYTRTPAGKFKFDGIMLRLPMLGYVNQLNQLARVCQSVAMLYKAGLPLSEIMTLVIEGTDNLVIADALKKVQQDMLKGEGLSQPMRHHSVFLPMMVQMVKVGEETGNLDINLAAVARSYETEAEDRTRTIIGLIPPVTTLLIGGVVGLLALSLVSAMYSIYGQMGG
jgi:type IV pilus assembly protein PilC